MEAECFASKWMNNFFATGERSRGIVLRSIVCPLAAVMPRRSRTTSGIKTVAILRSVRYHNPMKQLTLTLEDDTFDSAEQKAQKAGQSLPVVVMEFLRRFSGAGESEFQRLAREEALLWAKLEARGMSFSAGDRLPREELHDRHALR